MMKWEINVLNTGRLLKQVAKPVAPALMYDKLQFEIVFFSD